MTTKRKKTRSPSTSADRVKAYADAVVSGEIVAGPHVRNACQRHLLDLKEGKKRGLYFDDAAAERAFGFFENVLKLSEGQFEGLSFQLHASQAFIIGSIFGWKKKDGTRRFRRAYIEQGKGNGKSPVAGGIGLYGMTSDGEAGAQIYAAAAKKEQAGILFADAVKMVKKSPALVSRLEMSGGDGREYNIAYLASGSFFRPVSRDTGRTGSGPRPYFVLADEVHELPDRKIIETLERGFKFRRQPLLFMITNSGSDRNSVAWEEHEHAVKVAAGNWEAVNDPTFLGEPIDDNTFSYVCALDEKDDPLQDPSCWIKANPLLGVTITEQYLADTVKQAKAIPGQLNGILRLHFCVWTDAESAWMPRSAIEPLLADFDPIEEHQGKRIGVGLDLSQNRDLTAKACIVETGSIDIRVVRDGQESFVTKPTFDAWIEAWTPGDTMLARETQDKLPYSVWVEQGHLQAPDGQTISYRHVAQSLAEDASTFEVGLVAYDRYAFKRFEEDAQELGLAIEFAEHPQGGTKRGKPTESQKEAAKYGDAEPEGMWMPGSLRLLEDAILEGRIRLKRNPVLISAIMSSVLECDRWDNHWLSKTKSLNKIDPAIALCMAMGAINTASTTSGGKSFWETPRAA